MTIPKLTAEDLKKLPLRAIVALAARCARRVEHLAWLPDDHPAASGCRSAVRDALQMAEDFSRGLPCPSAESVIRRVEEFRSAGLADPVRQDAVAAVVQAACAAAAAVNALEIRSEPAERHPLGPAPEPGPLAQLPNVTAEIAALCAFTAAVDAADAVGYTESFVNGAVADYRKLHELGLGDYPDAGQPIDPSAQGPLGPFPIDSA